MSEKKPSRRETERELRRAIREEARYRAIDRQQVRILEAALIE